MKLAHALLGLIGLTAGCGRSVSRNAPTLSDASSTSSSGPIAATSSTPIVCDRHRMQVTNMVVTPVPPSPYPWLGKFSLEVEGCGFTIGAMTWMMRIGDQESFNGGGSETYLHWPLEKEPAIGDELFIGYGEPRMATGIHYEGLGKISVAPPSTR